MQKRFARFLGVIWRHSPFLVLLVLAALLRGLAWYAIHPGWWILGDSISYLYDAVQPRPEKWRPSGYSLLLLRPLLPVHRLSVVTGVQHVMGLLVAVAVYVTLLRFSVPRWAALLATLPAQFDSNLIATEQMLASEALFGALVAAALIVILWRADRPGLLAVLVAGLLLGLSAITRIVGLPLIAVALFALLLRRPRWLTVVALCLAFAVPVGAYSFWFYRTFGRVNLTASSGLFMYGRTTQFVNCNRVSFSDERLRRLCPTEPIGKRNEYYYVFAGDSPVAQLHLSFVDSNDVAGRFALEAIRAQPTDYVNQSWQGVLTVFGWDQNFGPNDVRFRVYEPLPEFAVYVGSVYQQGRDPSPRYRPFLVGMLAHYQDVAFVPGIALMLGLALAAAALVAGRDPDKRGLRSAVVLTAGAAAVLLLVPAITTIPAPRYLVPAVPQFCLAVGLSCRLLVNRWRVQRLLGRDPLIHRELAPRRTPRMVGDSGDGHDLPA